jgi:EamA domain-containing membrane protein RarD
MAQKLGWELEKTLVADEYQINEHKMIAVGITVCAALCYWFEWYQLAFWILVYALVYGILGALRAIMKASDISRGLWRPRQDRP